MNNNEKSVIMLEDIQQTAKMCEALMKSQHYSKIGAPGIYAIIEKAKSVGVSPLDALNGGMYFVQGKVEMSSSMMNQLIRQSKHSVTKDKRSDETICILHGKRADNGDTWTESFSIADAKLAGIYRNQWLKYPKDMLFARALSRLARQLFPDVIKGCYVQGEITDSVVEDQTQQASTVIPIQQGLLDDQVKELDRAIGDNEDLRQNVIGFIKNQKMGTELKDLHPRYFDRILERCNKEKVEEIQSSDVA